MPSLGADMEAGTLVQWLVQVGQPVRRGDIIAVVETQKGAIEIESFETGTIAELRVEPGQQVPVGTVLAVIGEAAATPAVPAAPAAPVLPTMPDLSAPTARDSQPSHASGAVPVVATPADPPLPSPRAPQPVQPPSAPPAASASPMPTASPRPWSVDHNWIRSSPSARHRAQELGIDLATVKGSGPHGAITREDVERAGGLPHPAPSPLAPPTPPSAPSAPEKRANPGQAMRAAIAAAMSKSNREIPHYYLGHTIDLHHAQTVLARFNEQRPVETRVLPAALLLYAVSRCLPRFPDLNGAWVDQAFVPATAINIGVAVSLRGGGLVVPALQHADQLDLVGIMDALRDLVARARAGKLRASDLSEGTITVTNLGDQGVESVHGVIYPGQAALIGFGKVMERPWAVQGMLAIRPLIHATLAGDHRASDGHRGSLFLAAVDRTLQELQIP